MVSRRSCPNCRGDKYLKVSVSSGQVEYRKCPLCNGTGYTISIHDHSIYDRGTMTR